ncbi:MAG: hypothetical protein ABI617_04480, partial [Sphingomicrobium sp.]
TGCGFGEDQACYVVTVPDGLSFLRDHNATGVAAFIVGTTGGKCLSIDCMGKRVGEIPLATLRAAHEGFFPALMSNEL